MRVISQYRNYDGPVAQPEEKMVLASGKEQVLQKELRAGPFRWMDVTEWEREEAKKAWPKMRGLAEGEDPIHRLSSFDTDYEAERRGWTLDEKQRVEDALRRALDPQFGGGAVGDYIIVEKAKAPAPWPSYPKLVVQGRRTIEHVVEKIVETVRELELDPETVIVFERENLNRQEVLDALAALQGVEENAEGSVIAA